MEDFSQDELIHEDDFRSFEEREFDEITEENQRKAQQALSAEEAEKLLELTPEERAAAVISEHDELFTAQNQNDVPMVAETIVVETSPNIEETINKKEAEANEQLFQGNPTGHLAAQEAHSYSSAHQQPLGDLKETRNHDAATRKVREMVKNLYPTALETIKTFRTHQGLRHAQSSINPGLVRSPMGTLQVG